MKPQRELTSVRRSQLITTFGIGAMIPVEQESFIVLGQEYWPAYWHSRTDGDYVDQETRRNVNELDHPDLSAAMGGKRFIVPPTGHVRVPVRRFPRWASCPKCHRLSEWHRLAYRDNEKKYQNICRYCLPENSRLVTSRFVVACLAGHLDDFPYFNWVHSGVDLEKTDGSHQLSLIATGQDESLKGIVVKCSCGASRTMEGALGKNSTKLTCRGERPWLPDAEPEGCSETLFGLQRGATRVWRGKTASAISLDKKEGAEFGIVRKYALQLDPGLQPSKEVFESMRPATMAGIAAFEGVELSALERAYQVIFGGSQETLTMGEIRQMEYDALCEGRPEDPNRDDDQAFICNVAIASENARVQGRLELTAAVPKLREVRALTGFSRVDPREGETAVSARLTADPRTNWLPAIEVFGEGIFVRFAEEDIREWEQSAFAIERAALINQAHRNDEESVDVTPRQLLLHSASHMILNELALQAGYPASSIRERIYDGPDQAGILLYTAGTDSAGSLGGLCALGTEANILKTIGSGVETAAWCSADPVCIESPVHGSRNLNLAACHYCMLLPEVSCEQQNQVLDRACLVGTPEYPMGGFFSSMLEG